MEAGTLRQGGTTTRPPVRTSGLARRVTETKASFKTSEFWLTLVVIAGILISASQISGGLDDEFVARQAWLYVAIVTAAYAIGRGLAKSGTSEPYSLDADGDDRGNASR